MTNKRRGSMSSRKKALSFIFFLILAAVTFVFIYDYMANQDGDITDKPNNNNQQPPDNKPDEKPQEYKAAPLVKREDGLYYVTDANSTLVIVNKKRNLPKDFVPEDLVPIGVSSPYGNLKIQREAGDALSQLFAKAKQDGFSLTVISAYRSYSFQKQTYDNHLAQYGPELTARYSAKPGQSEHQTGLAVDISSSSFGNQLDEAFANTPEGRWLRENAPKFGFIIRYLEGKETITGYGFEPWHIRYVGIEMAKKITLSNLTMEEFFGASDQ